MALTITSGKSICDVVCISGEWDETQFNIFVLKYPDYNIMMMPTFLCLTVAEGQKEERRMANGEVVNFSYPEVVADN